MFTYLKREPGFYRGVALLATPIIIQNMITSLLGMADTFMVGLLNQTSLAAVTLANIPLFVVQLFIFGVQSGSGVLVSQFWGKQDFASISRTLGTALRLSGAVSLCAALILLFFPVQFLSLFGNDPAIIALAAQYGRIAGLSYFINGLNMIYIGILRAMERPQPGMYILIVSMLCNTFLNWVLIFGKLGFPSLGVEGAAIATLISRILESVLICLHIRFNKDFHFDWKLVLRPGLDMTRRFFRYGGPVILNETLWGLGSSIFPTIMGHMAGSEALLAAYTLTGNVEKLCQVALFGIATATAIIIGREIGAGRPYHIVYQVGLTLDTIGFLTGVIVGIVLLALAHTLLPMYLFPLFHLSEEAISTAILMMTMLAVTLPLRDFNSTNIIGVLRGGGDVKVATFIDLIPLWCIAIPMAALCGLVLELGIFWVYLSLSAEQIGKFVPGLLRLRGGKWVHNITAGVPAEEFNGGT